MFWIIALAMAGLIAVVLFTGEINVRGTIFADRRKAPIHFWLSVGACVLVLVGLIVKAISPTD